MYAMRVEDFSARSLRYIFVSNISTSAQIITEKRKGYRPIAKASNIVQIESVKALNFMAIHVMKHRIKSWVRIIYSCMSDFYLDRYLNEFCFRTNCSQGKATIFHNVITNMVKKGKITSKKSHMHLTDDFEKFT